jgi:hypothetical protein
MTANPRELVRTVSSSKYPIAVARLGRLDAKQTPHHGGVRDRGASGVWLPGFELAALGLTKLTAEPCDTVVTYAAIRRTDVDVKRECRPTAICDGNTRPARLSSCSSIREIDVSCFADAPTCRCSAMRLDGARRFETPSR